MEERERGLPGRSRFYKIGFVVLLVVLLMLPSSGFCASWESIGPSGGNFLGSVTNPTDANEIKTITTSPSPCNIYHSTDGGTSWSKFGEIPTSYANDFCAFDFSTLYAITSSRCYWSTDGGVTWSDSRFPLDYGWGSQICVDPTGDSNNVYVAGRYSDYRVEDFTYDFVFFKSTDNGQNWTAKSFFKYEYFYPYDMAISDSEPNIIYVVGYHRNGNSSYGLVLKSTDGGENWTDISSTVSSLPNQYFYSIAVDPTDPERIYIGAYYYSYTGSYNYYVYRREPSGRPNHYIWTATPINRYARSIAIDPIEPSNILAAGSQSICISTNYGRTWATYDDCFLCT